MVRTELGSEGHSRTDEGLLGHSVRPISTGEVSTLFDSESLWYTEQIPSPSSGPTDRVEGSHEVFSRDHCRVTGTVRMYCRRVVKVSQK